MIEFIRFFKEAFESRFASIPDEPSPQNNSHSSSSVGYGVPVRNQMAGGHSSSTPVLTPMPVAAVHHQDLLPPPVAMLNIDPSFDDDEIDRRLECLQLQVPKFFLASLMKFSLVNVFSVGEYFQRNFSSYNVEKSSSRIAIESSLNVRGRRTGSRRRRYIVSHIGVDDQKTTATKRCRGIGKNSQV